MILRRVKRKKYPSVDDYHGFTLIEALTALFIFSLITLTFYSTFSIGLNRIKDSRSRLVAVSLSNEKMEIIRNIDYDDIGTVGGQIGGIIDQDEDIFRNSTLFHIHTEVGYVDDGLDDHYPADLIPNDYKRVVITVTWNNSGLSEGQVEIASQFSPPGLEVMSPGDGILSINVFSDQPDRAGVAGASVHIVNPDTGLDITQDTDSGGNIILVGPNVVESIQKYQITVAKDGYETVSTLPPYPATSFNPSDVHATVASGGVNMADIIQNKLAELSIVSEDLAGNALPDVSFHLLGGRQLGNEVLAPNAPVFQFNGDYQTDGSGDKSFGQVSPGQYVIQASSVSGYALAGFEPDSPISLRSEDVLTAKIRFAPQNATSLLVKALANDTEHTPISGASVRITSLGGYDQTVMTNSLGIAFFPVGSEIFEPGTYDIAITAAGYNDHSSQAECLTEILKEETITMVAL